MKVASMSKILPLSSIFVVRDGAVHVVHGALPLLGLLADAAPGGVQQGGRHPVPRQQGHRRLQPARHLGHGQFHVNALERETKITYTSGCNILPHISHPAGGLEHVQPGASHPDRRREEEEETATTCKDKKCQ